MSVVVRVATAASGQMALDATSHRVIQAGRMILRQVADDIGASDRDYQLASEFFACGFATGPPKSDPGNDCEQPCGSKSDSFQHCPAGSSLTFGDHFPDHFGRTMLPVVFASSVHEGE